MSGRAFFMIGYFMGCGYLIAKTGADKKIARAAKAGYTEVVKYTTNAMLDAAEKRPAIKGDVA